MIDRTEVARSDPTADVRVAATASKRTDAGIHVEVVMRRHAERGDDRSLVGADGRFGGRQ